MTADATLNVFVIAGIVAGGLALLGVLSKGGAWLWRTFAGLKDFLDDWKGEPGRPGQPARPGIPARIAAIEAEMLPDHGSSLRDAVDRLERGNRRMEDGLAAHLEQHRTAGTISIFNNTGSTGVPPDDPGDVDEHRHHRPEEGG